MTFQSKTFPELLRLHHLEEMFGVGSTTIYAQIKAGVLPKPHKGIIGRASYWRLSEVNAAIAERLGTNAQQKGN